MGHHHQNSCTKLKPFGHGEEVRYEGNVEIIGVCLSLVLKVALVSFITYKYIIIT
jgi:hypothetical protein